MHEYDMENSNSIFNISTFENLGNHSFLDYKDILDERFFVNSNNIVKVITNSQSMDCDQPLDRTGCLQKVGNLYEYCFDRSQDLSLTVPTEAKCRQRVCWVPRILS